MKARGGLVGLAKRLFVWLASIASIYPVVYVLGIALKSNDDFLSNPNGLPSRFLWGNFAKAWKLGKMSLYGWNTVYVTALSILACILLSAMAGYAIEKLCGRREGRAYYLFFVAGIIMPLQVIMLPLFKILKALSLLNNAPGLVLVYVALNLPFSIFMFTGYFKSIPNELIEAATIDGCGAFASFWKIVFPLCKTMCSTIAIFVGINIWKDFSVPLMFVSSPNLKTLSIGLLNFSNQYNTNWTLLAAAMIMQTLPILALYLAMQERFIAGITAGAVKE